MAARDGGISTDDLVLPPPTATPAPTPTPQPTPIPSPEPTSIPEAPPYLGWSDPAAVGEPWGSTVEGLLTFRGNPTRTYYGKGPVPEGPIKKWSYPQNQNMCGSTTLNNEDEQWCGTGWTGQPAVFRYRDSTWVVFGALDGAVHFVDAESGQPILEPYQTEDIIKLSLIHI